MRYEEERLSAAVDELKTFSAKITDNATLADVTVIIAGFETMRPYVSVGLKVSPSCETLEAITRLRDSGLLTRQLWMTLTNAVDLARKRNLAGPVQPAVRKPCRRVTSRSLGRSLALGANRMNRLA